MSERFCRMPAQALGNPNLRRLELQVLMALCLHAGQDGTVYLGQAKISAYTGYSAARVSAAIAALEGQNLLRKFRTRHKSGRLGALSYEILFRDPPVADLEDVGAPVARRRKVEKAMPVAQGGQVQLPEAGNIVHLRREKEVAQGGQGFSLGLSGSKSQSDSALHRPDGDALRPVSAEELPDALIRRAIEIAARVDGTLARICRETGIHSKRLRDFRLERTQVRWTDIERAKFVAVEPFAAALRIIRAESAA